MGSVEQQLQQRRAITLDLFTQWGPVWEAIRALRKTWDITSIPQVPPEPPFSSLNPLDPLCANMRERLHLPLFPPRLGAFRTLYGTCVPDGNPSGTDALGWQRWAPFLSACVVYDPPELELLDFANHDDHKAAQLHMMTVYQVAEEWAEAAHELHSGMARLNHAREAYPTPLYPEDPESFPADYDQEIAIINRYHVRLAAAYKLSVVPPAPARPRGRPPLDDLTAVQCAIWKRAGWTHHAIAAAFGWQDHPDSTDPRHRKNRSEDHVKRGQQILQSRNYSG